MVITDYPKPFVTVDIIIFTVMNDDLRVLLIRRGIEPSKGKWALPGGFVRIKESLEEAALRELEEESGVKNVYLEQLYTFGAPKRDPRGRVITVSYFALINESQATKQKLKASADAANAKWFPAYNLPKLAFDHEQILEYGIQRLKWKLEYTTLAFKLLSKEFTLTQLQTVYEIVLHRKLDKRNFRKKISSLDLVEETGKLTEGVAHRPAKLYRCKKKIGEIIEIL